jgi:hypothetical protein
MGRPGLGRRRQAGSPARRGGGGKKIEVCGVLYVRCRHLLYGGLQCCEASPWQSSAVLQPMRRSRGRACSRALHVRHSVCMPPMIPSRWEVCLSHIITEDAPTYHEVPFCLDIQHLSMS